MSWGSSEFSGETSDDSDFDQAGVAFVAASGDEGAPADLAGGLAQRPGRRRHVAHLELEQCLVQRDRLERQRRRPQRLRAATVIPDRRGDPDIDGASHPRRRL